MKLNILERIVAIQTIAEYGQGNFMTFKLIDSLKKKLVANEEETIKYDLKIEGDDYKWNELGFTEYVDIDITDGEIKLIVNQLIELDKKDLLTSNHTSLIEKVIPNPEEVLKPLTL